MTTQTITVPFHDQSLTAALVDSIPCVAMKPICENIGLDWFSQMKRIKRNPVLNEGKVIMTSPSNGGLQEMLMLPIKYLNGWLFGVDASRVKPEIKARLIEYQRECFDVLANHFMPQQTPPAWKSSIARKPKAGDKPLPETIQSAINRRAQTLSRRHYDDYHVVLQRMARWMMDQYDLKGEDLIEALQQEDLGWVGYPDMKPRESAEAKLPVVVDCPKYHFPLGNLDISNPIGKNVWMTYERLTNSRSQIEPLLDKLIHDGHDVSGAREEYRALRVLVNNFYFQLDALRKMFDGLDKVGHNIYIN